MAAVVLAGCAGARRPAAILEVSETFTCPNPLSTTLITIKPDGSVTSTMFEGVQPPFDRTTRRKMSLSPKDAAELFAFVASSGWETIPAQGSWGPPGEAVCMDCCSGSVEVKTAKESRRITYRGEEAKPKELEALISGIDAILRRYEWQEDRYPWQ